MIYTSYYNKVKSLDPADNCFIVVSNSRPMWFPYCNELREVFPGWDLVNAWKRGAITWEQYTQRYLKILEHVNKDAIQRTLREFDKRYDNVFLLCWEKSGDHCHRYILADWLDMGIIEY